MSAMCKWCGRQIDEDDIDWCPQCGKDGIAHPAPSVDAREVTSNPKSNDANVTIVDEWAKSQGFDGFVRDHAAVMRNLSKWLDAHDAALLKEERERILKAIGNLRPSERTWDNLEAAIEGRNE